LSTSPHCISSTKDHCCAVNQLKISYYALVYLPYFVVYQTRSFFVYYSILCIRCNVEYTFPCLRMCARICARWRAPCH
jgi:hypothetical protein